jgi:chorismate lyase/3-hydroxybenzoate synthase
LGLLVNYGPVSSEPASASSEYRPIGSICPAKGSAPTEWPANAVPRFQVSVDCLGGEQYARQWWCVDDEVTAVSSDTAGNLAISWAQTREFIFAVVSVEDRMPLEKQTFRAYQVLLEYLRLQGNPYLLRVWNYVPGINRSENGVERYQLFNSGRKQVYRELHHSLGEGAPAACALGTQSGGLQVAMLACSHPPVAIENPRQVTPCRYPKQYGEDPPIFSRATWLRQRSAADLLLISGTASIVGHQTLHPGDVLAQTRETVRNIQAVLDTANRTAGKVLWTLGGLRGRVYIRHAEDYPSVSGCLQAEGLTQFCYVQADICRSDLLVEIEAEGQGLHAR